VEENGGKWGMEHSLRGRRNPGSSNQPSSQTLYHIKFYLSNIKHIKIWANLSQILISKCYNSCLLYYRISGYLCIPWDFWIPFVMSNYIGRLRRSGAAEKTVYKKTLTIIPIYSILNTILI